MYIQKFEPFRTHYIHCQLRDTCVSRCTIHAINKHICIMSLIESRRESHRLEAVQRRAARFCTGDYNQKSSVTNMIKDLGWISLEERRKKARLTMFHKITNNMVGIRASDHLTPLGETRTRKNNSRNFQTIHARLDKYKHSYFPRTIREWNALSNVNTTAKTTELFKELLNN